MNKKAFVIGLIIGLLFCICLVGFANARNINDIPDVSFSVPTQPNGETIEQTNIIERMVQDNKPGSIKHLYIISPYSGQVILYSTVKGKVTSSGKRIKPASLSSAEYGSKIEVGKNHMWNYYTDEIMQDDGTYGSSSDYIFWWDVRGVYHQHFITGGQIIHVSSEPISVKDVIINIEQQNI